ncbi:hypothetical protein [Streptomyces sp. CA-106110]|uniref:hypothetical protein n=1 Tax=Streptomyces sp. CA-106110 TaxID=3240044 RepID=UPI003D90F6D7
MIGPREAAADHVGLRLRSGRRQDARPVAEILRRIGKPIELHSTDLLDQSDPSNA